MRDQDAVRVRLGIVGDEESEEEVERGSDHLVDSGFIGDFAITGEPTDLHIGVEAKGVLALRVEVGGVAAHGATPWLGDNAVLRAIDVFRSIESLPFARHSSELFDRPSINLGRILGGDALNKVPDRCAIDVDIRYLPDQDPADLLEQVRGMPDAEVEPLFTRPPAVVDRELPYVRALREAATGPSRRRADERRARRRLRRGLLPAGRGAGGRVRPGWGGASRARGVGLDLLAADLPADARHLPALASRPGSTAERPMAETGAQASRRPRATTSRRRSRSATGGASPLGSLVIVTAVAAATAASILLYVGSIADALSHNNVLQNKVERVLAQTEGGEPQNILILGSDKRASEPEDPGRSDTTILLRLDPDNDAIALMSIPRDLKVEIPGVRHRQVLLRLRLRRARS